MCCFLYVVYSFYFCKKLVPCIRLARRITKDATKAYTRFPRDTFFEINTDFCVRTVWSLGLMVDLLIYHEVHELSLSS